MDINSIPEWQKAQRGELYRAFVPELVAQRDRCTAACDRFNSNTDLSRRTRAILWRDITLDTRAVPPQAASQEDDNELFDDEPWVNAPTHADYGINIKLGKGTFVNWGSTFVDTCPIVIGDRVLIGPNCSFYSGTHPIDPALRDGTNGPELGKAISIGDDCWFGGNTIVLPGIKIGRGCSIGAGSVVTKDIPAFHVAAGNPARILRKIETAMDPEQSTSRVPANGLVKEGIERVLKEATQQNGLQ